MTDGRTDGQTDGRTDGGDCNIPDAFLKKRGDNYTTKTISAGPPWAHQRNVIILIAFRWRAYSGPLCLLGIVF